MMKILSFIISLALSTTAMAQQLRVSGKITSSDDGSPMPGVTVQVVGTNTFAQTNDEGSYTINATANGKLSFSFIGFAKQEISINGRSTINVSLEPDASMLEEVVATGYGTATRNKFAGAATILGKEITENKPVGSFTQILQGRAPGVLVNSGSGQPGANATITIRGVQSIQGAGAQPLFVIDGVPTDASTFYSLNPNDFESITILKDANSTAIYGARGGVGVVVITTRQGKAGTTEYTARIQTGFTAPPDFSRLNLMSSSELLDYEERIGLMTNTGTLMPGWYYSRKNPANASKTEQELLAFDQELQKRRNTNTDIADLLFRTGVTTSYELNASGGNERLRYFASGSYFNQEGIDKTSGLRRFAARYNLNSSGKRLNIIWNNTLGYAERTNAVGDLYGNSTLNPFQMIYRAKPYDNPYLADGTLNFGGGGTNLNLKTLANLLERSQSTRDLNKQMKYNTGLTLSYDITKDLTLRNVFGLDASNTLYETYIDPGTYSGSTQTYQNGWAREGTGIRAELINTTSLTYAKKINIDNSFSVSGYYEAIRGYNKGLGFQLYNLNPALLNTGQGNTPLPTNGAATMAQNASSARSGYGIRSFFATAEYNYKDKFIINGIARRDGTSRIQNSANNEITTWSAGLVYNIGSENFVKNIDAISSARLRVNYGTVPNIGSISASSYGVVATSVPNYAGSQLPAFGSTSYVGSTLPGLSPTSPGNPNLRIERIQKLNFGLDLKMFRDRATLAVDVYQNKTIDLFVRQPLSSTTGFGSLDINAGTMTNKGVEIMAGVDVIKNRDLLVSVGFNHAINNNKIVDLGLVDEYFLGTFVIRKGLPYGSHYTYHYLGADKETGRPTYETPDGGVTTDLAQAGQFAKWGTYLPKHVGGFNLDVRYKGFSIGSQFSYQFHVTRSNNVRNWITDGTAGYASAVNQSRELIDNQWSKPGDDKFFPSPAYAKNFTSSDLEDARFLRFRNLNIAYQIPGIRLGEKGYFKGANVYVQFHNLAIWSPWRGVDPEDNNNISLVEYPNPRMMVFGIDLKL
jgi:TonB-linked SusC/RagA family outer membrane protein